MIVCESGCRKASSGVAPQVFDKSVPAMIIAGIVFLTGLQALIIR